MNNKLNEANLHIRQYDATIEPDAEMQNWVHSAVAKKIRQVGTKVRRCPHILTQWSRRLLWLNA